MRGWGLVEYFWGSSSRDDVNTFKTNMTVIRFSVGVWLLSEGFPKSTGYMMSGLHSKHLTGRSRQGLL